MCATGGGRENGGGEKRCHFHTCVQRCILSTWGNVDNVQACVLGMCRWGKRGALRMRINENSQKNRIAYLLKNALQKSFRLFKMNKKKLRFYLHLFFSVRRLRGTLKD